MCFVFRSAPSFPFVMKIVDEIEEFCTSIRHLVAARRRRRRHTYYIIYNSMAMAHRSPPVVAAARRGGRGGGEWGVASTRLAIVMVCVALLQLSLFGQLQLRSVRSVRGDQDIAGWAC